MRTKNTSDGQKRPSFIEAARRAQIIECAIETIATLGYAQASLAQTARPVRRIVMINGVIPHPGQSFLEASKNEQVFANFITRFLARIAPGMSEVCPLTELPKVEYVYISAEKDDAIRPEWEQWAAREYLHVEPVIIKGAGHATIILNQVSEVVDAATEGL